MVQKKMFNLEHFVYFVIVFGTLDYTEDFSKLFCFSGSKIADTEDHLSNVINQWYWATGKYYVLVTRVVYIQVRI